MTTEEQAKRLIELFYNGVRNRHQKDYSRHTAKLCALIHIEEQISLLNQMQLDGSLDDFWGFENRLLELQEIKQKLNKQQL